MTDDIVEQLQALPPELPDVPDRVEQVRRRARRMRRLWLSGAAAATAIVVAVPALVVSQLAGGQTSRPRPAEDPLVEIATACPVTGLTLQPLPQGVALTHTAEQARAVLDDAGSRSNGMKTLEVVPALVRDPLAVKLRLGSPNVPRSMWVIRQVVSLISAPAQSRNSGSMSPPGATLALAGTRVEQLRLVDDATLTPALNAACAPISATRGDVGFGLADNIRVAATGLIARAGTGYVLCKGGTATAQLGGTVGRPWGGPNCEDQVALVGDDAALAKLAGTRHEITGTWGHDTLTITSIGAPHDPYPPSLTTPPCPAPAGGWGHVAPSKTPNLDDTAWRHYSSTHPGVITSIASFRPAELSPVLTLASTEPEATRAALEGAYPRALCVVQSTYAAGQVQAARREIIRAFGEHRLPGVDSFGGISVTPQGQAVLEMTALTDRAELHTALADIPSGLLHIQPWIQVLK